MYFLEDLVKTYNDNQVEIDGKWVPARPEIFCFRCRVKDAWAVLFGKADAIKWPFGQ